MTKKKKQRRIQPKTTILPAGWGAVKPETRVVRWVEVGPTKTEWQVVFQDGTRHVFYSEEDVRKHLNAVALSFALGWDPKCTSELRLNVMRVERHQHVGVDPAFVLAK